MNLNREEQLLLLYSAWSVLGVVGKFEGDHVVIVLNSAVDKLQAELAAGLESEQTAGARSEDTAETEQAAGSENPAEWVIGATRRYEDGGGRLQRG